MNELKYEMNKEEIKISSEMIPGGWELKGADFTNKVKLANKVKQC